MTFTATLKMPRLRRWGGPSANTQNIFVLYKDSIEPTPAASSTQTLAVLSVRGGGCSFSADGCKLYAASTTPERNFKPPEMPRPAHL